MKIAGLDLSVTSSGIIIEEVDKNLDILNIERHGFTTVKKNSELSGLIYYKIENFRNHYQRYDFFYNYVVDGCRDCDYVAVEAYAISKSGIAGRIFDLAEFGGNIKQKLFRMGKKLRFYPPNQNKKLFSGYGSADKIGMRDALVEKNQNRTYGDILLDVSDLPPVKNGKEGSKPTSDIIDAFSLCESLRLELKLKNGVETLESQPKYVQEVFTVKTDEHPAGLINSDFIYK